MTDHDVLVSLLERRYSCRAYLEAEVPRPDIERMLAVAQRTASWCNTQPWQVAVTSGRSTEELAAALTAAAVEGPRRSDLPGPEAYVGAYQDRRRAAGHGLHASLGIERGDREARARQAQENFRFFGAPHVAIITSDRQLGTYGAVDCGAYVGALLLAAESLHLAAVAQGSVAMVSDAVRTFLQLPDDRVVVCAVAFGYADPSHPANTFRTSRSSLEDVVTWV